MKKLKKKIKKKTKSPKNITATVSLARIGDNSVGLRVDTNVHSVIPAGVVAPGCAFGTGLDGGIGDLEVGGGVARIASLTPTRDNSGYSIEGGSQIG